jgi:hypothetical protein
MNQIPAKSIQEGDKILSFEIHKFIHCVRNKEELHGNGRNLTNYRGISLSSNSHDNLSTIFHTSLTPHTDEIIGERRCGFRRNRSTTDQIFCIRNILQRK